MSETNDDHDSFAQFGFGIDYLAEIKAAQTALTEDERAAIYGYTELAAFQINTALRTGAALPAREQREMELLEAVVGRTRTPRTFRVSRVATVKQLGLESHDQLPELEGEVIQDRAFLSTSLRAIPSQELLDSIPDTERIVMDILVPEGTHAAYIADSSHDPQEQELLVVRNAELFYVPHQPVAAEAQNRTVRFTLVQEPK